MIIAAQVIGTQLVAHDKKDILDHTSPKTKIFSAGYSKSPKGAKIKFQMNQKI
tara:strand:+ start:1050 stop:1208 length:159 start_codon:yes stop_codon:yes gene_type:complete